jgi:hypothetical protein
LIKLANTYACHLHADAVGILFHPGDIMALQQLSEEQVRTWTRAQKDEWWFKNIYRGDMPQLTFRSALTGFY